MPLLLLGERPAKHGPSGQQKKKLGLQMYFTMVDVNRRSHIDVWLRVAGFKDNRGRKLGRATTVREGREVAGERTLPEYPSLLPRRA